MIGSILGMISWIVSYSRLQESQREPIVSVFDLVGPRKLMQLKSVMIKLVIKPSL